MGKLPAIQFYPGDWRKDAAVQSLSFHDRGVWFEMLMLMHDSERRGVLILNGHAMTDEMIARSIGLDNQIFNQTLTTLLTYGVASREPKTGAVMNRRMVRDEEIRKIRTEAGKKGGNPVLLNQKSTTKDNQKSTPSFSVSVSDKDKSISEEAKASSSPRPAVGDVPDEDGLPKPSIAPPVEWPAWDGPPEPTVLPPVNPEQWIYDAYPRKEGHLEAIKAIKSALRRIQKGENVIPAIPDLREARIYLYRRVQTYARSPAGSRADKTLIPHPKTWFSQARYLDDESNWQRTGEERYENPKNIGTNNIAVLTESLRKSQARADANGNLSEGDAGQCDLGNLLGAIVERKR